MRLRRSNPPVGLLRRVALGQESVYRVVGATPEMVEAEVISAPGLRRGTRVRFTAAAASAMARPALDPSRSAIPSQPSDEAPPRRVAAGPLVRG
jgi:hypothetical protein